MLRLHFLLIKTPPGFRWTASAWYSHISLWQGDSMHYRMQCSAICRLCQHLSALLPPPWSGLAPGSAPPSVPLPRRRGPGIGWTWLCRAPKSWLVAQQERGPLSSSAPRGLPPWVSFHSRGGRPQASRAQAAPASCAGVWRPHPASLSWCPCSGGDWWRQLRVECSLDSPCLMLQINK